MKLTPKLILATALFIVSGITLGIKLLNPTQINITITGSEIKTLPVQEFFTFSDVMVCVIAASILCITAMYVLYSRNVSINNNVIENERQKMELERQKWEHTLKTLKNDEKIIYEKIFADGGIIYQNELIEKTGFSASKVTRCVDALENRGIVKRTKKGLYNIISL